MKFFSLEMTETLCSKVDERITMPALEEEELQPIKIPPHKFAPEVVLKYPGS